MKYFLDTEFLEGKQDKTFLGVKYGETKPTIDLISIGIVGEIQYETKIPLEKQFEYMKEYGMKFTDKPQVTKEYYAISKDFNLKAAWKNEWVRENVLKPIYKELHDEENAYARQALYRANVYIREMEFNFCYKAFKRLLKKYGKTNKQIAHEIRLFVGCYTETTKKLDDNNNWFEEINTVIADNVQFYAHYADYDWVVFCQLFGTMMDLPKGFPMFAFDLKQELDEKLSGKMIRDNQSLDARELVELRNLSTLKDRLDWITKYSKCYPKQTNEHNALQDAHFNYNLYKFLKSI